MKTAVTITCWLAVLLLAAALRFHDIGSRPLHADEATGARITARMMESDDYRFDPKHYHGPTLGLLGGAVANFAGSTGWRDLQITPLRAVTSAAGLLLVMIPLLLRRRFGDAPMLVAAMFLATSPLLVYFSRMYIHEMLLALFGALALWQATGTRLRWLAGLWVGLMFATKETFAISMIAWGAAATAVYLMETRGRIDLPGLWRSCGRDALVAGVISLIVGFAFYTQGFRHWQGAVDAVRTYLIYETVPGHDKPFAWYALLMLWPEARGGFRWGEMVLALAALMAVTISLRPGAMPRSSVLAVRFLAFSAVFHGLVYSLISYKTPWLMVLPWAHVAVLAGFAVCHPALDARRGMKIAAGALMLVAAGAQLAQTTRSSFRFASDSRNPYAYPASSSDLNSLEAWVAALDAATDFQSIEPIIVVGTEYWPLPWYLRGRQYVGYYQAPPEHIERLPLVFDLAGIDDWMIATHVPIPRGLRDGLPVTAWVRFDFWDAYVATMPDSAAAQD
ncbi:MAG: flippase activity-associated protein Agl23 [Luteolibacter sp.]